MEPISRLSFQDRDLYLQTQQSPSVNSIHTGVDVTLTIESNGSSKQVCQECLQPILLPRSSSDDRTKTQVQRICDICTRAIVQNQNLPVSIVGPVIEDPVEEDYDDNDCKRKLKYMKYTVATAVATIGLWLIISSVSGGDAISS